MVSTPSPISQETLRNWVKKAFGDLSFSRTDWSSGALDGSPDYLRYCCKGPTWEVVKAGGEIPGTPEPPDVVYHQNLVIDPQRLCDEFWKANYDTWKEKQANGKREVNLNEYIEKVRKMVRDSEIPDTWHYKCEAAHQLLMEYYKGKVNDHVLFPQLQSIMYSLDRVETVRGSFDRMLKKFSK